MLEEEDDDDGTPSLEILVSCGDEGVEELLTNNSTGLI